MYFQNQAPFDIKNEFPAVASNDLKPPKPNFNLDCDSSQPREPFNVYEDMNYNGPTVDSLRSILSLVSSGKKPVPDLNITNASSVMSSSYPEVPGIRRMSYEYLDAGHVHVDVRSAAFEILTIESPSHEQSGQHQAKQIKLIINTANHYLFVTNV